MCLTGFMTDQGVRPGQVWTDDHGKMVQVLRVIGPLATCDVWYEATKDPHETTVATRRFGPGGFYRLIEEAETDA